MLKTCAVTLTGKRPPNRDPELQRTELVQDTKALMVQDTKTCIPSIEVDQVKLIRYTANRFCSQLYKIRVSYSPSLMCHQTSEDIKNHFTSQAADLSRCTASSDPNSKSRLTKSLLLFGGRMPNSVAFNATQNSNTLFTLLILKKEIRLSAFDK